ncbi:MAG TPA: hypothetical protein VE734_06445 [Terriglobales bacterium]|nr:hypothetical protein [Terriglobales bacterium]
MNCAEFQKVLPYIIETGGNAEEEAHLRSCAVCSDLVEDLKYIAEAAKLLLPMHDPGPRVWNGIRGALEREGLVRPLAGTARFRPQAAAVLKQRRWGTGGSMLALSAVLLFAISMVWLRNNSARQAQPVATAAVTAVVSAAPMDDEDAQILDFVGQKAPSMLPTYRENLDSVNAYIRDASRTLQQDPSDIGARDHLIRACGEKVLLYEMALARSLH